MIKEDQIVCDRCGKSRYVSYRKVLGKQFDKRVAMRKLAKAKGWTRVKNGSWVDLCPACQGER